MTQREQYKQAEAPTTFPECIKEITIKRSPYYFDTVHVDMKAGTWSARFTTTHDNMLTRIHEITAEMERTQ